jgi:outer membrane protein assembly factor BamB
MKAPRPIAVIAALAFSHKETSMKVSILNSFSKCLLQISLLLLSSLCFSGTITLSLKTGPPTTTTLVSGKGFTPSATVSIFFDNTKLTTATSNAAGAFSNCAIAVPVSAAPGKHYIRARVLSTGASAHAPFLVRTNWNQFRFTSDHTGSNPYENVLSATTVGGLKQRWSFATGGESYPYSSPAVVDGLVYVGSFDTNLYTVKTNSGALAWKFTTTGHYPSSTAVSDGVVYITCHDTFALNASTGELLWKFLMTGGYSSPTVADGVVYASSQIGNTLYALDAKTGALLWTYVAENWIESSPAVANGVVYLASLDYNLYALDAHTGALLWKFATAGMLRSSPAVSNGIVYFGSDYPDETFYALNADSGTLLWKYMTNTSVDSSPALANGTVFVGAGNDLYALDAATGNLRWTFDTGNRISSSAAVANGVVYIGSSNFLGTGDLFAIASDTGRLLWQTYGVGGVLSSPAVSDGAVYFVTEDGIIRRFDLTGSR